MPVVAASTPWRRRDHPRGVAATTPAASPRPRRGAGATRRRDVDAPPLRYVRRVVGECLIYTLAWRREPSYAAALLKTRILPCLVSYAAPLPRGWCPHPRFWTAAQKRYAERLTCDLAVRTLMWRRESSVGRRLWWEGVVRFLMDASTAVPEGWG